MSERRILATTKLTSSNQTTVPKPVREKLNLEPGDVIVWVEEKSHIYVEKG